MRDPEEKITRVTDFEHLGAEELGSIYESLLELQFIRFEISAGFAELGDADGTGNERKLTGSFYTPTSLITSLLDTALEPVIDRALATARGTASKSSNGSKSAKTADGSPSPPAAAGEGRGEVGSSTAHCALRTPHSSEAGSDYTTVAEKALLGLKICDPACGSGHFLVAAAHRIARRVAALRTGEREPPVQAVRHALREVAAHCLYGVDLNPLSVDSAKSLFGWKRSNRAAPWLSSMATSSVGTHCLAVRPLS